MPPTKVERTYGGTTVVGPSCVGGGRAVGRELSPGTAGQMDQNPVLRLRRRRPPNRPLTPRRPGVSGRAPGPDPPPSHPVPTRRPGPAQAPRTPADRPPRRPDPPPGRPGGAAPPGRPTDPPPAPHPPGRRPRRHETRTARDNNVGILGHTLHAIRIGGSPADEQVLDTVAVKRLGQPHEIVRRPVSRGHAPLQPPRPAAPRAPPATATRLPLNQYAARPTGPSRHQPSPAAHAATPPPTARPSLRVALPHPILPGRCPPMATARGATRFR